MKKAQDMVKAGKTMNGKPTILIVDNDTGARKRFSAIFKKEGFEVLAVGTANEAITAARGKPFNVVLLDIGLPDTPGTELIAPLKKLQPDTAIVMVAADPTLDSAVRSINEGAQRYLIKPLNMDEVLAVVTDALEKQRLVIENGALHEEVRLSEKHYRTITENMTDTVWVMDLNLKATYISPSVTKDRGYTLKELNALPLDKQVTPQSLKTLKSIIAEEMTAERLANKDVTISRSMELEFYRKDGTTIWGELAVTLVRDADGKPREIIGVGRDVTERKKSEAALLRAAQEWRTTFDSITDMISIQDADYRIQRVSRSFADFVKISPKDLIGKFCYEVIHGTTEPPPFCPHSKVFETKRSVEGEIFEPRLGIYMQLVDSPIFDAKGDVVGSVHVIKNITDRKRAEEALIESEGRYRHLFEGATVGIFHSLPEGKYLRVNTALARMVGFDSPEEMVSSVKDIASELYAEPGQRSALLEEAIRKDGWATTEGRFKRRDGSIRWGRQSVHPVYNSEGTIEYFEGFTEDITERRISEEKIQESERTLSMAQRIASVGSWDWDLVTDRLVWSDETYKIFGRDPAVYTPVVSDTLTLVHPDDREMAERIVVQAVEDEDTYELEYRIITPAGEAKWIYALGEIVRDAKGSPICLRGAIQDVTERRQREDAVRQWKERYELVVAASGQVAYDYDVPTGRIVWGLTMEELLGYAPEEYGGGFDQWLEWLHPDDKEETLRLLNQAEAACSFWDVQYRLRHKGGHYVWIRDRGFFVPDEKGKASRQMGMLEDVTERKSAEEKISYLKKFNENVINFMDDSIDIIDESYRIVFQNRAAKERFGDGIGQICHEFYHGIDVPCNGCVTLETIREHKQFVKEATYSNGSVLEIHISPILMPEGHYCSLEIIRDVTERRQMEDALRESDVRFRKLSANVPGMIFQFLKRPDGTYCVPFTSEGIRDIFGCSPQDVREDFSPIAGAIVPGDFDKVVTSIELSADRMTLWQCEYRVQIPGGPVRWLFAQSTPEKLADGGIIWHGFNADITERIRIEEALKKSEEQFRSLVENISDVVFNVDIDGTITYMSPVAEGITGYTTDEYVRKNLAEFIHPDDLPDLIGSFGRSLQGIKEEAEFRVVTKDGSYRYVRSSSNPVMDGGSVIGLTGLITDITERRQAEDELRKSEERFRVGAVSASDLIYEWDIKRGSLDWYGNIDEMLGYDPGEFPRTIEAWEEVIHPEDRDRVLAALEQHVKKKVPYNEEYRVIQKDGTIRYWTDRGSAMFDETGNAYGMIGACSDITDRRQAEENIQEINRLLFDRTLELRASEEKFRSLFETSRDFMCITDLEGRFIDTNDAAQEFFGYSPEELSKITMLELYSNPDDRQEIINGIIEKGYVTNLEARLKKKSGETIDVLVSVNLKKDDNGKPVHFFSSARDMTEKKRMEMQLLQSEKLSAVGTMISGVAHELNNPLTSIIGNAQLLSRRDVPDDIRAKLDVILRESRRSAKIVGGLLAFAREHRPERMMTDINEILTESLKLREYDLRVSNIDVRTSFADDLPENFVDPYQLQQVFINLINNARDALAGQEQAALVIRSYREDSLILVEFEDNGPGIPNDLINRIFDPFFTTKDVGKGTGLGLSMAYGIIHEHNGTIEVHSKPGKGSKFTITLPLIEGGKTVREEIRAHIQAPPGAKGVLVVEDEASLRNLLSDALAEAGFLLETASTGEEAVSLLEIRHFDAVVSDIKMPGIGGRELYLYIQKHHPEIAEKVIFITGDVLSKDTQSFLQITNNRFIEKPFDVDALVAMLNDLVST